jgi:putative DNA primase/helicase
MSVAPVVDSIPHLLATRPQWLLWRYESKEGEKKPRKVPYYVSGNRRTGEQGSTPDRAALVTLAAAAEALNKASSKWTGLGFAFLPGDGLIGVDLDGMIDLESGEITDRGRGIIQACASYTEFSPSGKGVHIICQGQTTSFKSNEVGVEVFCGRQYFTFTGRRYPDTPAVVETMSESTLKRLRATVESGRKRKDGAPSTAPTPALYGRAKVESALAFVSPDCGYNDWIAIGMAIYGELGPEAFDVFDAWSARSSKYPGRGGVETHWKSFRADAGSGPLFKRAIDAGWRPPRDNTRGHSGSGERHSSPAVPGEMPPDYLHDMPPPDMPPDDGDGTFTADGRRVIRHDPGRIALILDEMGAALGEFSAQGGSLFRWGSGLTRVYVAKADSAGPVRRWAGSVSLHPVSAPHLAELSTRSAVHERWDGRSEKYKEIDCPPKAAEAYLARGNWPELPELSGFIEGPSITLDGRVLDVPGYDSQTGIYAAWSHIPGYVSPPRAPTMRDAAQALDVLLAAISTFPFLEPADTNAALAGLILAVCRRSLPSAPLLCVTAPTPGTGKTLLTDTISILATGRRASVMAMGHDDAEADKRLAGVLLAGDSIINIDNVERPLGGDLLCQVLSQPVFKTRPLGASAMVDVPTCAIMAATGNNLSVQGDLKRRVTMIRMDARMERPETRDFSGEPHLDKIRRMRGELITAALTIPLAYLAAGAPRVGSTPLGGFEDWDTLCRRPLIWLGLDDPLLASQLLRDQDPDMETTRALMTAWRDVFAGNAVGVADVVREGTRLGEGFDPSAQSKPELNEALLMVTGGRAITTSKLGAWLRGHKDRIVSGMRIHTPGQDRNGTARWQVLHVQDDAAGFTSGGRM